MRTVVVESNKSSRLREHLARRFNQRVSTKMLCLSGFFHAQTTTAPLALLSTPDCGGEGEKRFSSTTDASQQQGERLHEGSAPSDKQGLGLINRHCTGQTPALINKAAEHNKGQTPLWTPNRVT